MALVVGMSQADTSASIMTVLSIQGIWEEKLDLSSLTTLRACNPGLRNTISATMLRFLCKSRTDHLRFDVDLGDFNKDHFCRYVVSCLCTEVVTELRRERELHWLQDHRQSPRAKRNLLLAVCSRGKSDALFWLLDAFGCGNGESGATGDGGALAQISANENEARPAVNASRWQDTFFRLMKTACTEGFLDILTELPAWALLRAPAAESNWVRFRSQLPDNANFEKDILEPLCARRAAKHVRILLDQTSVFNDQTSVFNGADALIGSVRRGDVATVRARSWTRVWIPTSKTYIPRRR